MIKRLPLYFRHVAYNLRGGFLIRPLIIALALGLAGALIGGFEQAMPGFSAWVPSWLFPSHRDWQVAQTILSVIATSVMTVVSIVFAILLMTLTLASMQFSPRILVSFAKDRITQWTLGVFLGTFCYCLAALPSAHSAPKGFEPVVTVMGAMALAIACVALLLFFIHHISQSISANYIVDRIAAETEEMIWTMMPSLARTYRSNISEEPEPTGREAPVLSDVSGYIRYIDAERLKALAVSNKMAIYVLRRVGHFVPAGVPLMVVSKEDRLTPDLSKALLATFDIGATRTLQEDVEFGILQIVDIALRAISPAVNDPTTAINCIDQLSRILICFASRERPDTCLYDPPGTVRVSLKRPTFEKHVDSAFDQIRLYAQSDFAVTLRLLRALTDVATTIPDQATREMLAARGRRIVEGYQRQESEEASEMKQRQAELDRLAASAS